MGSGAPFVDGDASVPVINRTLLAVVPPAFCTVTPTASEPQLVRTSDVTVTIKFTGCGVGVGVGDGDGDGEGDGFGDGDGDGDGVGVGVGLGDGVGPPG